MELETFKLLQVIFRAYSRQSVKYLIDNYLRIKIIVKIHCSSAQTFLEQLKLSHPERVVFLSKEKSKRQKKQFVCIVIDHPLRLSLTQTLMDNVDQIIVVGEGGQSNNIFGLEQKCQQRPTKAILLKTALPAFDEFAQMLDSYLSVCELFYGHLHLVVSCFQAIANSDLSLQMRAVQGDEFADFKQQGYFRILQQRANRITLEQLSYVCRVQRCNWGQVLMFQGGVDVLIVWVTLNRFPLLGVVPEMLLNKKQERLMPVFLQSELGFKVFKRKQVWKQKMQDLDATTVIFNVKEYNQNTRCQISKCFTNIANIFFSRSFIQRETVLLEQNIKNCTRICQILEIPLVPLLKQLMKNNQ